MVKSYGFMCINWRNVPLRQRALKDQHIPFVLHLYYQNHVPGSGYAQDVPLTLAAMSAYHKNHHHAVVSVLKPSRSTSAGRTTGPPQIVAEYKCERLTRDGPPCDHSVAVPFRKHWETPRYKLMCCECVAGFAWCHQLMNSMTIVDRRNGRCAMCPAEFVMQVGSITDHGVLENDRPASS